MKQCVCKPYKKGAVAISKSTTRYSKFVIKLSLYFVYLILNATAPSRASGATRQTSLPRAAHPSERLLFNMKFRRNFILNKNTERFYPLCNFNVLLKLKFISEIISKLRYSNSFLLHAVSVSYSNHSVCF